LQLIGAPSSIPLEAALGTYWELTLPITSRKSVKYEKYQRSLKDFFGPFAHEKTLT
jgi:hypothetical protein